MLNCLYFSCYFDVQKFKTDFDLQLVGATIIDLTANTHMYYVWQLINQLEPKQSETKVCGDFFDLGYMDDVVVCHQRPPVRGGGATTNSVAMTTIMVVMAYIMLCL